MMTMMLMLKLVIASALGLLSLLDITGMPSATTATAFVFHSVNGISKRGNADPSGRQTAPNAPHSSSLDGIGAGNDGASCHTSGGIPDTSCRLPRVPSALSHGDKKNVRGGPSRLHDAFKEVEEIVRYEVHEEELEVDEGIGSSSIDGSISGSTPSSTSSSASSSTSSSTSSGTSSSTSSNTSSGSSGGRIFQEPTANGPVSLDETYRRYVSSFPSEEKPTFFSMIQCMQKEELGIHEARCASFLLDDEDGDEGPDKDDGDGDDHDDEEEKEEHTTSFEPVNGWTNLTKNIATANTTSLPVEQPASLNLTGSFSYMELIQPASFHNTSHRHDRSLLPWVALRIKNVIGSTSSQEQHGIAQYVRVVRAAFTRGHLLHSDFLDFVKAKRKPQARDAPSRPSNSRISERAQHTTKDTDLLHESFVSFWQSCMTPAAEGAMQTMFYDAFSGRAPSRDTLNIYCKDSKDSNDNNTGAASRAVSYVEGDPVDDTDEVATFAGSSHVGRDTDSTHDLFPSTFELEGAVPEGKRCGCDDEHLPSSFSVSATSAPCTSPTAASNAIDSRKDTKNMLDEEAAKDSDTSSPLFAQALAGRKGGGKGQRHRPKRWWGGAWSNRHR